MLCTLRVLFSEQLSICRLSPLKSLRVYLCTHFVGSELASFRRIMGEIELQRENSREELSYLAVELVRELIFFANRRLSFRVRGVVCSEGCYSLANIYRRPVTDDVFFVN